MRFSLSLSQFEPIFVSFVAISTVLCRLSEFTLTGLRVNFSDFLIKGKEFLFELARKVFQVRGIGVLLYKQ